MGQNLKEFGANIKKVGGNEGDKCKYPIRLETVCEDVSSHYEYWKTYINENSKDCCNLRRSK